MNCVVCEGTSGTPHIFREMMFGTRDEFAYWECSGCGCLQIAEVPANLGVYYPDDYYSFSVRTSPLQLLLYRMYSKAPRLAGLLGGTPGTFQSVIEAKPKPGARMLDVGCGAGRLIKILRSIGFDAHGIDPFAKTETAYIKRASLDQISKGWDLIMFHHSLEHMPDHLGVLRTAREKLAEGGTCLVRIPVANWAWQHYRENWVQLDAPRHLIIHTPQSFRRVSEAAGFQITQITFDSKAFQFYGSELYRRDIPLNEENSKAAQLEKASMRRLDMRAAELNRQQLGDQASFYLKTVAL
jgi:SAM-dependent methyltransferase